MSDLHGSRKRNAPNCISNHVYLPGTHHSTPCALSFPSSFDIFCWRLDSPSNTDEIPRITHSTGELESDDCDVFLFVNNAAYNLIEIDYPFTSLTLWFVAAVVWSLSFQFILRRLAFLTRTYQPILNTPLLQQRDSQRTRLITTPLSWNITARAPFTAAQLSELLAVTSVLWSFMRAPQQHITPCY